MAGGGGGDLDPQLRGHGGGARAGLRGHHHGHQRGHRVRQGGDHAECQQTGRNTGEISGHYGYGLI